MKIVITKTDGRWLINGKPYSQTTEKEKAFFDDFLMVMRGHNERENKNRLENSNKVIRLAS